MFYTEQIEKEQWDVIKTQLESEEQRATLLRVIDIAEVIGADMVAATFRSSFPISVLLPSLTNFVREQKVCDMQAEKLQAMVNAIPSERKVLPVKPFAYAWQGRNVVSKFEDNFDEMMTFDDLVHQDTHYSDEELSALKSFLSWCGTSIGTEITKAIDSCFTDNKRREITLYRAQGKTLEEIGDLYNITRERVRQIEKKSVCRFPVKTAENILMLISATQRGAEILPAQDIANYCGDDSILFLYLLRNAEGVKHYRYAKNLDAFILGNAPLEEEHVHSFLDELPDRIDAADLKTYLARASEKGLPPELIEHQIRTDYHYIESIHTWQRGTLNLRQMSREILKEFDPDGIHITVHEELQRFREKLYARFGSEIRVSEGNRALSIIIADVGMLRDRSTYVSEREHMSFLSESVNLWIRATKMSICLVPCMKLSNQSFSKPGLITVIFSKESYGMSGISFILFLVIASLRVDARPVYMAQWNCILRTLVAMCRFPKSGKRSPESRMLC